MRANVKEIKRGNYLFVMEVDTGGAGIEYNCWVYKENGEVLKDDTGCQIVKFFGNTFNMAHFNNFINKFIQDENYRNKFLFSNT